jgi:hypothetical protein
VYIFTPWSQLSHCLLVDCLHSLNARSAARGGTPTVLDNKLTSTPCSKPAGRAPQGRRLALKHGQGKARVPRIHNCQSPQRHNILYRRPPHQTKGCEHGASSSRRLPAGAARRMWVGKSWNWRSPCCQNQALPNLQHDSWVLPCWGSAARGAAAYVHVRCSQSLSPESLPSHSALGAARGCTDLLLLVAFAALLPPAPLRRQTKRKRMYRLAVRHCNVPAALCIAQTQRLPFPHRIVGTWHCRPSAQALTNCPLVC